MCPFYIVFGTRPLSKHLITYPREYNRGDSKVAETESIGMCLSANASEHPALEGKESAKVGTKEWAEHNKNIDVGCANGCTYCYAYGMLGLRFKLVKSHEEWMCPRANSNGEKERPKKLDGRIMFPTSHDIHVGNIDRVVVFLRRWLEVGNDILVTSKPSYVCIKRLCDELGEFKDQITFRFTIGSMNDDTTRFWEPKAPLFEERLRALVYAYSKGFRTSVSMEPFLDSSVVRVFHKLKDFVTDTIWVGKMNYIDQYVKRDEMDAESLAFLYEVESCQTDESIWRLYNELKRESKVRWKDSIREVVGLAEYDGVA